MIPGLAVILLLAIWGAPAGAFTLDIAQYTSGGQTQTVITKGWQSPTVTFDVDSSCTPYLSGINGALTSAMNLWNGVPSANLTVSLGGTITISQPIAAIVGSGGAPTGNPFIYCDVNFSAIAGDADHIPGYAGGTRMDTSSGKIIGSALVLNVQAGAGANVATVSESLTSVVLAHEIGHVLGLGHSSDSAALMYYSTQTSRTLALAQDDVDGITYLYPRQEPGNGKMFGCASLGTVSGPVADPEGSGSAPAAAEFAVVLGAVAMIWRVARRVSSRQFQFE